MGRDGKTCGACNGAGGYYAHPNGNSGDTDRVEKEWVTCSACSGTGIV